MQHYIFFSEHLSNSNQIFGVNTLTPYPL